MKPRLTSANITDDDLTKLYDERDSLGYEVQQWKSTYGEHALRDTLARLKKAEARVAELEEIAANARKLISGWLKTAGEHYSVSTIDAVKNDSLFAGMQEGRANQYSDCANELKDVLDGEDPDTWEHGVGIQITTTEAADA
ncbi:hypothetical protein [Streptomyces bluensis]|uniref:Uncharacterized protein n=1 Tax=Streptomyces bluensis TaxID=33897 RepID=A0ABW6UTY6_9ACTN